MALASGLTAALGDTLSPLVFHAFELVLPGPAYIRLLDGAGSATFSSKTFVGRDATYGALGAISTIEDSLEARTPRYQIELEPPTTAAITTLSAPSLQGAQASLWFGAVDRTTGQVIATPELLLVGELDYVTAALDQSSRRVSLYIASAFERLFAGDEAARLTPAFHKSIWPGELGLDFVVDATADPYWGVSAPVTPGIVSGGAAGTGGFRGSSGQGLVF